MAFPLSSNTISLGRGFPVLLMSISVSESYNARYVDDILSGTKVTGMFEGQNV